MILVGNIMNTVGCSIPWMYSHGTRDIPHGTTPPPPPRHCTSLLRRFPMIVSCRLSTRRKVRAWPLGYLIIERY